MSTIVYHEQQSSCHESYFFESRTLNLKLNSSRVLQSCANFHQEAVSSKTEYVSKSSSSSNSKTSGSFSSIEALSSKKDGKESVYVHPLVKQSAFALSEKSLLMCTESLGSETGCCETGSSIFSLPMTGEESQPRQKCNKIKDVEPRNPRPKYEKTKKDVLVNDGNFPPPLTTISGSNPTQVIPYRENGRLVIQAVTPPPVRSYMEAERSDGRLKLTLVSDDFSDDDDDIDVSDDGCGCSFDDQEADSCDCQIETNNYNNVLKSKVETTEEQQENDVEENIEKEELKVCDHKSNTSYLLEDGISGKKVELRVKFGLGKIQRTSRCKERGQGNKRLINWEPFWVAI